MQKRLFYKNPLLIIYVPGYLSGEDNQKEVKKKIYKLYNIDPEDPSSPDVVIFKWDSVASYAGALHNSVQAADDLVQYLKELPCGNHITIIGHSLGALVVSKAMKKIPFNSYYGARQVILLGAAMDAHANLKHMCDVTMYPVINVVNPEDTILNTLYKTFNDDVALGSHGSYCKHNRNYVEFKLLDREPKQARVDSFKRLANKLLDVTGHSASRVYLDALVNKEYKINR